MRPRRHSRLSRYPALASAAAILLLYIANLPFYSGSTIGRSYAWRMEHGRLTIARSRTRNPESFYIAANSEGLRWSPALRYSALADWSVTIPLYIPLALTVAWSLRAWGAVRSRPNSCPSCGYPRASLPPSSPCPECGSTEHTPVPPPARSKAHA